MYESNESSINILGIIKKVILVIIAILVIFGILTLVTRCSKNVSENKKHNTNNEIKEEVNLTDELQMMEDGLLSFITIDNLPKDLGASRTVKLKYLYDKGVKVIKDDNGNTCNENKSNAEITKLENNYAVKLSLTCGKNSKYKIIYVGCFESCANGGICKGLESTKGGVCTQVKEESTSEESTNSASQNTNVSNTSNATNSSTSNKVPAKPAQNNVTQSTSTNSTTNSTTKPSSNTTTSQTSTSKNVLEYQFKKCTTNYICKNGDKPNSNNQCLVSNTVLDKQPALVKEGTTKTTYYCANGTLEGSQCKITSTNKVCNWVNKGLVYFSRSSDAVNTSSVKYTYKGLVTGKGYSYTKEVYECTNKTTTQYVAAGVFRDTTPTTYSCFDSSYRYNSYSGYCEKSIINTYYEKAIIDSSSCEYTWSTSTSLPGWTYTGVSKWIRK